MVKRNKKVKLFSEFASREQIEILNRLMTVLPDPDEILAQNGYDYKIYRDLLTDPHLTATIQQRKMQIQQMKWEIDYNGDDKIKQKAKNIIDELPIPHIISDIMDCIFFGMSIQEVYWGLDDDGQIVPMDLVAKPQEWFIFTLDNKLKLRKNVDGTYLFAEGKELPELKFIIHRFNPTYTNPYGEKILSRCYWPITFKRAATECWQLMVERYGMPYLIGYHPASWDQTQIDEFLDQLTDMTKENIAAFSEALKDMIELKESPQYDIGQLYDILIRHHNKEIAKAVLTVTLTTDISNTGSYKASEIHKEMLEYIGLADKRMVEAGIDRLLQYWTFINYGHIDAPKINLKKKETIVEESGERDEKLVKMGIRFTKSYYKKRYNLEDDDFEMEDNSSPNKKTKAAGN